jgi:hypothetical protein
MLRYRCVIPSRDVFIPWHWGSDDALGHRHAQTGHHVDNFAADRHLGPLRWQSPGGTVNLTE